MKYFKLVLTFLMIHQIFNLTSVYSLNPLISARYCNNQSRNYASQTKKKIKPVSLQSLLPNGGINPVSPRHRPVSYVNNSRSQIINPTQSQLYLQLKNQVQNPITNISCNQPIQTSISNTPHYHPPQNPSTPHFHSHQPSTIPNHYPPQTAPITHSHVFQNSNIAYSYSPQLPLFNQNQFQSTTSFTPQNLTMQQIIQYLFGSQGINLSKNFQNRTLTFQTQCVAYCNALPSNPVCDSTNHLYRNECEAQCFQRTIIKTNLRYGMCCCDDSHFNFSSSSGVKIYQGKVGGGDRVCLSKCLYDCLGGESEINIDSLNPISFTSSISVSGVAPCNTPS